MNAELQTARCEMPGRRFEPASQRLRPELLLLLAATAAAAGCGSAAPESAPPQPYKILLLPVEGAEQAIASPPAADEEGDPVPFDLTSEDLERAVFEGVRDSRAFSGIVTVPAEVRTAGAGGDAMSAAADFARRSDADLILRVTVKSARIRDLGNNSSSFWSTFLWFMVPLPLWTVNDRTYDANLAVEAALYEPRDVVRPTATVVATTGRQELDLWDRGLSFWVPVVPPPFLAGSPKTVSATVTRRAVTELMDELVRELRTRPIPAVFDVEVTPGADGLSVKVATRRQLRSLEVWSAGRLVRTWAETDLVPEGDSTGEVRVYRRTLKLDRAADGGEVRVIAEDETGVREVRTVTLRGRP